MRVLDWNHVWCSGTAEPKMPAKAFILQSVEDLFFRTVSLTELKSDGI